MVDKRRRGRLSPGRIDHSPFEVAGAGDTMTADFKGEFRLSHKLRASGCLGFLPSSPSNIQGCRSAAGERQAAHVFRAKRRGASPPEVAIGGIGRLFAGRVCQRSACGARGRLDLTT